MNITEFRKKYPAYDDLSDGALADALYSKYYTDLDRADFDSRFLSAPQDVQVPVVPDTSGVPAVPDTSGVPAVPETSGIPGVGAAPQAPQRRFTQEEIDAQGGEFSRAGKSSVDSLQAMVIGGAEVVGELTGLYDTAGLAAARKEQERQAAEYAPPRVSSYTEVETGEDLFDYIASTVGGGIVATAAILGTATGIVVGAPVLGVSAGVASGLAGATALLGGSLIGAGDVYSTLLDEGVDKESAADIAGIAGPAMGALELVPFASIAKNLAKAPLKEEIKKGVLRRLAGAGLKTGVAESVTEAGQEGISITAEAIGTGKTPDFQEVKERLINSAFGGFLIGSPMGVGSGYIGERRRGSVTDGDPEEGGAPEAGEALLEELLGDPDTDIRDAITDDGVSLASSIIGKFEKEGRTKLATMGRQLLAKDTDDNYILSGQTAQMQFAALGVIRELNSGANANNIDPDFTSIMDREAEGADVLLSPEGKPISGRYVSEDVAGTDAAMPIAGRVFVDPKQFPLSAVVHETIHHWDTVYSRLDPEAHKLWVEAFKPSDSFKGGLSDEVISIIGEETVNEFDAKLRGITMTQRELTAYAFQAHTEARLSKKLPEQGRGVLARGFKELSNYVGRVIGKFKGTPSMTQADAFKYVLEGKLTGDLQQIVADRQGGKRAKKGKTGTVAETAIARVNDATESVVAKGSVGSVPTGDLQILRTGTEGLTLRQPTKREKSTNRNKSLQFDSDFDLLAYMLRPGAQQPTEANVAIYSKILEDNGFNVQEVRAYGTQVGAAVNKVFKDSDEGRGSIKIPDTRTKAPDVSEGLSADTTSYEDFLSEGRSSTTTTETTDAEGRTTTTVKETDAPPLAASRSGDVVIDEANKSEAGPGLFADKPTPEQVIADALKIKPPPPDADTPQIRLGDMMEILDTPPESAGGFVDAPPSTESEYRTFAQSIIPMLEGREALTLPEGTKKSTIGIVADYLDARFRKLSGVNRSEESPENVEAMAQQLADESDHAVRLDANAATWYRDKVENAMKIASLVYPELSTDVAASTQFRFILAITSNGAAVSENSQASLDLYGLAKENKSAGRDIMPAGSIKGGGKEAKAMRFAFDTYNTLTKQIGVDAFHRFLNTKFTVRDLESILKKLSDASGIKPVKVSGENADTVVYGSALFGPKIGNGFFQNLQGNFEPLTADRWWVRTWGRLTGKLYDPIEGDNYNKQVGRFLNALRSLPKSALRGRKISVLKKDKGELLSLAKEIRAEYTRGGYKDKSEINQAAKNLFEGQTRVREAPYSGGERNYMRAVVARARSLLEDRGIFLEPADIQALVWYPEKELYGSIFGVGSKRSAPTDYEIEFAKEALKYGVTEKQIQSAVRPREDGSGRPNHLGIIKDTIKKSKAGGQRYPEPFGDAEKVSFVEGVEGLTTKAHQDVLGGDYSEIIAPLSDPSEERLGSRITPSLNDSLKKFKVSQIDANGDVQVIEGEYIPEVDMIELHGASAAATNKISNPAGANVKGIFGLLNRIGSFDKTKFIAAVADPYNYLIKQGADAAYIHARLAHNTSGTIGELIIGGLAKWTDRGFVERVDENGNPEKRFGIPDIIEDIASKYGNRGLHLWGGYVQAVRSRRLLEEGRENNLTALEINDLLRLGDLYPEFEIARKKWVKFNDGILDIAVDSGYLSREEAEKWKEYGDYVPLYRIDDRATTNVGDEIAAKLSAGGIGRVTSPSQRLMGGTADVNSIVPNMILNTEFLITKSMRNFAARKAVEELGPKTGFNLMTEVPKSKAVMKKTNAAGMRNAVEKVLGPDHPMLDDLNAVEGLYDVITFEPRERDKKSETIHVRDKDADGNTVLKYYDISDPLLFDALTFVPSHKLGTFMKIMNWQRGAFSQMITKFPDFIAANFIRDTMSARAQYPGQHSQLMGALKGVKESFKSEGVMRELRLNGGTAIGGYHTDNQLRRYKNMTGDLDENHLVVTAKNTWAIWDRLGEAFENANRVAVYNAAKNQGKSGFEAGFNSKDVLDFSLSGESQILKYFITTVPFLNARIQGLYKFGRAGSKTFGGTGANRSNFYMWTGSYALVASALYAMNSEDERYQALSDTAKDMNLHLYLDNLPGVTPEILKKVGLPAKLTIPKPFEVGFLGMTIPERLMQQAMEDDATAGDFGKSLAAGVTGVFKVNPFEALGPVVKGLAEDQLNFNFFRMRPIVPTFSQKYSRSIPEKIFGSAVDVEGLIIKDPYASKLINEIGEATNFAPQRIKNALDSWFPKVGAFVAGVGDMFYRSSKGLPPVPRNFSETPLGKATYGRFVGRGYSPYSQQERELRELNLQISGITAALRVQKNEGGDGFSTRIKLMKERQNMLNYRGAISQSIKTLNNLTKIRQRIDQQNLPTEERLERQEVIDIKKMRLSQTMLGKFKSSAREAK